MIDLISPQRFYQFEFKVNKDETINTIIDLKHVEEITLRESKYKKEIAIFTSRSNRPPSFVELEESEVAQEVYQKLVKAWTTYKLATER